MKKIINNLLYNTETAKNLGDYWNGLPSNDFSYCCETLYQKRTGELHYAPLFRSVNSNANFPSVPPRFMPTR